MRRARDQAPYSSRSQLESKSKSHVRLSSAVARGKRQAQIAAAHVMHWRAGGNGDSALCTRISRASRQRKRFGAKLRPPSTLCACDA
eukprot:6173926-Pleurochrysis_carterae.AAC.4